MSRVIRVRLTESRSFFPWKKEVLLSGSCRGVLPMGIIEKEDIIWGLFNTEGAQDADTGETPNVKLSDDIFTSDIIKWIVIIVAVGVCVTIIIPVVKYTIYRSKYNKANINDKLIMTYSRRIKKWVRKNKALKSKVNYKEQIQYLIDVDVIKMSGEDKEKVIDILGKAGFSKELIKEDEDELVRRNLYL